MKLYPNWKASLLVFGVLIIIVVGNFFWQVQRINKSFEEHSLEHSRVLGAVVELNIRNAIISSTSMKIIISSFLRNSARFISYLDQMEPFSAQELAVFARESGLSGITIFRNTRQDPKITIKQNSVLNKKEQVSAPKEWISIAQCPEINKLNFLPERHLYIYTFPGSKGLPSSRDNCIVVGMSSEETEKIKNKMSVESLLDMLILMEGIEYVRFEKKSANTTLPSHKPILVNINGKPISETKITMGDKELTVGLEADFFSGRIQSLRKELYVFLSFLVLFGSFSSWWLYKIQQHRLEQTRIFERKMARQLEQASLGRAAATITHEMRNPLNAISMGLQRLQIETNSLDDEHTNLIISMREAVERSNSVLVNLQQYIHSFKLNKKNIAIANLIESITVLYQSQCKDNSIKFELELDKTILIEGDANYLSQAFENLIKNAVEAQLVDGFIKITLSKTETDCLVLLENRCKMLKPEESKMILAPYFTTKTYGTGLGLAISKKIIEAHSGHLETNFKIDIFSVYVSLPLIEEADEGEVSS